MTVTWAALIVLGVTVVAVSAMLLARRFAPEGSHFQDGDRAAGVFGVLATGFAVLLGFVVFLAFESFDTSRSGAESEAEIVAQQFETAQFMPVSARGALSGQLVCYARTVVSQEWPQMEAGKFGDAINPWGLATFHTLQRVEPKTAVEQTAFAKWFDERKERQDARSDRTHGAEGVIPVALWIVLFVSATVIFVFMLFFADRAEHPVVQGAMMGSIAIVITSTLLLLWFLDNPYHTGVSGLKPVAMERTLGLLEQETQAAGIRFVIPCDESGIARGS